MRRSLRLGLIGAGPWGRKIIAALARVPGMRLTVVASGNPETPSLVPRDCRVVPDWRGVAGNKDLDGVILAVPPSLHFSMCKMSIETGLGVFVEKPLSLSPKEARALLSLGRSKGARVLLDHIYLHHPGYLKLKRMTAKLGPIRSIKTTGGNRGPFRPGTPPLWDYGPHDLAVCFDLLGRPRRIAALREQTRPGEVWRLSLAWAGGAAAECVVGNGFARRERRFEVACARGALTLDDAAKTLTLRRGSGPERTLPFPPRPPLECALREFARRLRSRRAAWRDLELGAAVVEALARLA